MQQIEALKELVEAGSFTRAAARMFITQPSLTKQIKNLEDSVGARIINRRNTGVTLTPEGKILYDYARRILKLREEAREKILSVQDHESGHIFLSASTIPATYILPAVFARLRKRHPDIRLHLHMNDSEETYQTILNDQAEIGFVGREFFDKKLVIEPLWKDRLVLAVPSDHPWGVKKHVTLKDIAKEPFIMRERGSGTREALESCLQAGKGGSLSRFNIACEMGSSEAVKEAIIAGLGISILSVHALKREIDQGIIKTVAMKDCSVERNFYLIYRKNFHLMNYHERFLAVARNHRL